MKEKGLIKKLSFMLLVTALVIFAFLQFSMPVFAQQESTVTLDEAKGNLTITGDPDKYTYQNDMLTITQSGDFTLTGSFERTKNTSAWLTISEGVTANIVLDNVWINDNERRTNSTIDLGENSVLNLKLKNENTLKAYSPWTGAVLIAGSDSALLRILSDDNGSLTLEEQYYQRYTPVSSLKNIVIESGNVHGLIDDIVNENKEPLYGVDWCLFNESEIKNLVINGESYNVNYTFNDKYVYLTKPENGYYEVEVETKGSTYNGRLQFSNGKFYYIELEEKKTIFNGWEISGKLGEDFAIDYSAREIKYLKNGSHAIEGDNTETNNAIRFQEGFNGTIQLHNVKSTAGKEIISLPENTKVEINFTGENTLKCTEGNKATISTTYESSSLTFDSDTNGILNVNSSDSGVAIGAYGSTYNITFNGGIINATGSSYQCADIGPALYPGGEAKNIVVNGGVVNCLTSGLGSAYGGNRFYQISTEIIINGGTVTAPYIGGSTNASTSVFINGGSVKGEIRTVTPLQTSESKTISLLTLPVSGTVDEILVDGNNFNISAKHKDDNNLYLYVTKENHVLTINGQEIPLIWQDDSNSFKLNNVWTEELSITGWTYNENANAPTATAQFGNVVFTYSSEENGTYTNEVPKDAGTWYVKASVEGTDDYMDLESVPLSFEIKKAKPTGTPKFTAITKSGKTLGDANLVKTVSSSEEGFSVAGTVKWNDDDTTVVEANKSYGWTFTPTDETNYEIVTGTAVVWSQGSSISVPVTSQPATEIKPDGTVVTTEKKTDGTVVTTEKRPDGTAVKTETKRDGKTTAQVTLPEGKGETEIKIPVDLGEKDGRVAVKITNSAGEETIYADYSNKEVSLNVYSDSTIEILDEFTSLSDVKLIEGVENTTIKASSDLGEKSIKIAWKKSKGYKVDYYQIFRSTKRYSGYGVKPFFTTKSGTSKFYINTKSLKKGTTYYYKVRGVRMIDGKKYYTRWSTKAYRTFK